ncbi:hypothetical protein BJX66DRAFT_154027 [Aspergillus keveii]|uniref:Secreted protein n=1 Tax=Aspergillus keveii TaxID=714993 RepID=A0ABR4GAB6_9EURO
MTISCLCFHFLLAPSRSHICYFVRCYYYWVAIPTPSFCEKRRGGKEKPGGSLCLILPFAYSPSVLVFCPFSWEAV